MRIDGASDEPIPNLNTPKGYCEPAPARQARRCCNSSIRRTPHRGLEQTELEARIASYELAFRMQAEAPEAVDLAQETAATQQLYGLDQKETETFGRNCLLARRLVERGVRFVQLYHGAGSKWDAHAAIEAEPHGTLHADGPADRRAC